VIKGLGITLWAILPGFFIDPDTGRDTLVLRFANTVTHSDYLPCCNSSLDSTEPSTRALGVSNSALRHVDEQFGLELTAERRGRTLHLPRAPTAEGIVEVSTKS